MRDWIKYLPTKETIRAQKSLGPVRDWLLEPELWHFHRRAVSGAVFIGLFCALLPIPFQMVVAGLLAVFARCNVPIAVALVWITNPFTFAPIFFFAYKLGAWLLDMEVAHIEWDTALVLVDHGRHRRTAVARLSDLRLGERPHWRRAVALAVATACGTALAAAACTACRTARG